MAKTTSKHTPGPWRLGGDNINGHGVLGRAHGFYICLIPDDAEPEQLANDWDDARKLLKRLAAI